MRVRCRRCTLDHVRAPNGACPRCGCAVVVARACGIAHMTGGRADCPAGGCALHRALFPTAAGRVGDPCEVEALVPRGPGGALVATTLEALRARGEDGGGRPVRERVAVGAPG